jgi:hypothetical protein
VVEGRVRDCNKDRYGEWGLVPVADCSKIPESFTLPLV